MVFLDDLLGKCSPKKLPGRLPGAPPGPPPLPRGIPGLFFRFWMSKTRKVDSHPTDFGLNLNSTY